MTHLSVSTIVGRRRLFGYFGVGAGAAVLLGAVSAASQINNSSEAEPADSAAKPTSDWVVGLLVAIVGNHSGKLVVRTRGDSTTVSPGQVMSVTLAPRSAGLTEGARMYVTSANTDPVAEPLLVYTQAELLNFLESKLVTSAGVYRTDGYTTVRSNSGAEAVSPVQLAKLLKSRRIGVLSTENERSGESYAVQLAAV